jgi:hypothetical protein
MTLLPSLNLESKESWKVADVVHFCKLVWEKEMKRKQLWNDFLQRHQKRMNYSDRSIDTIFDQGNQAFSSLLLKCKEVRESLADFHYISTMALSTIEFQNWLEVYRDMAEDKSEIERCAWKLSCFLSLGKNYTRRKRLLLSASCLAFFSYLPAVISSSQDHDIESEHNNLLNENEEETDKETQTEESNDRDDLERKILATTIFVQDKLKRMFQGIPISNKRRKFSESKNDQDNDLHEKSQSHFSWIKSNSSTTNDCLTTIVESANTLHWHLYCTFPDRAFGPPIFRQEIETLMVDTISPIVAGLERFCEGSDGQMTKSSAILIDGAIAMKRRELQAKLPVLKGLWYPLLSIFDESILLDEKYRNSAIIHRLITDVTESRNRPQAHSPVAYVVEYLPGESRMSEACQDQVKSILARLSSEASSVSPREKVITLEANLAWNEWCLMVTDRRYAKPGSRLQLLIEKSNVESSEEANLPDLRNLIWAILSPVIAKFSRSGLKNCQECPMSLGEGNIELKLLNDVDPTQQFVLSFVSLYYQLLENFLLVVSLDSKVQCEWMKEKSFHHGFLSCSIFCIVKALGQPSSWTGLPQSDLAISIEVTEATPTSTLYFLPLVKRCLQISWTLPKFLEARIDHAQIVLLDSLVWEQSHNMISDWDIIVMIQRYHSYQNKESEFSSSHVSDTSNSEWKDKSGTASVSSDFVQNCQALWIPHILEQIKEQIQSRIIAMSFLLLGIRDSLSEVLSSTRGVLSFILQHQVRLLRNRHLDQILICILNAITQHYSLDLTFRQITDAYISIVNAKHTTARDWQAIDTYHIGSKLQMDDCCSLEKFYTQVFSPKIEPYFGENMNTLNTRSEVITMSLSDSDNQIGKSNVLLDVNEIS